MGIGHQVAAGMGKAIQNVRAGEEKLVSRRLELPPAQITVTSPAFASGGALPVSATADGDGVPPSIAWRGIPASARSIVLICEDPDAPFPKPFIHWIAYGIPAASDGSIQSPAPREGKNSMKKSGFTPAAPPPGHGTHHYHFQLFALDHYLDLEPEADRSSVVDAMRGHVVAWGELVGTYERK